MRISPNSCHTNKIAGLVPRFGICYPACLKQHLTSPMFPRRRTFAEITLKSFFLGAFLAVILGAANMYLGLFESV